MHAAILRRDAVDDGVSNPRGDNVVTVNLALVVTATILVIARFWTRVVINNMLGLDDWCVLMALVSDVHMATLNGCASVVNVRTADCNNHDWAVLWRFVS